MSDKEQLLAMADRAESIGVNLAKRAFEDSIMWNAEALAHSAHGFTVAKALRALAAIDNGGQNADR